MGIPKLFRWLSQRYPCLSEQVFEWQIPEFDNLYLDMNGIVHNCSHPNDIDICFRISEEQIFKDIFNYLDFIFNIIKPKKVFFMAIDGVAPRAKMNQQRSRRFRTAQESFLKEQDYLKKGLKLPTESRFDSNCITPGTEFMIKLQEQLKYYIVKKISTDSLWRNIKVYLSGHESPGEGEHKIMDFIKYSRSQPDYDPYTRHCMYGLDADLIMLGLSSHEPYFSLLREEVKFTNQKKNDAVRSPDKINFFLLHLTILRDYLEIEFSDIKTLCPLLFNIEKIIDDWIFMNILIGNDFVPNLPNYHINQNIINILTKAYIEVFPSLKGYINETGTLNLNRLKIFFKKLSEIERENFFEYSKFLSYDGSKKEFKKEINLINYFDENEEIINELLEFDVKNNSLDQVTDKDLNLNEYEFQTFKKKYYKEKLNFKDESDLEKIVFFYLEALQWNLHYYFNSCSSWSWYYPYHYAPFVSDIKDFKDFFFLFKKEKPLLPYEQLLIVLPISSMKFLPLSYQKMMISKNSPLYGLFPTSFEVDLNNKKNPWEAIVLIPFIDQDLLLKASTIAKQGLNEEEKKHNIHGPQLLYTYTPSLKPSYNSPLPTVFPNITSNHANCEEISYNKFQLSADKIKKGISKKIKLNSQYYGFPSLKFLKFTAQIKVSKVRVFETYSKNESVILSLSKSNANDINILKKYLGKNLYFNWPFLKECKLTSIIYGKIVYCIKNQNIIVREATLNDLNIYERNKKKLIKSYIEKKGIEVSEDDVFCTVLPVSGYVIKMNEDGFLSKEKQYAREVYALASTIIPKLCVKTSEDFNESVEDFYKPGLKCFCLQEEYYGDFGEILSFNENNKTVRIKLMASEEPDLSEIIQLEKEILNDNYLDTNSLAEELDLPVNHVSKITGAVFVSINDNKGNKMDQKKNIGLNLKFNEKQMQIANYSRRVDNTWFFSNSIYQIILEYIKKFPHVANCIFNKSNSLTIGDLFPCENGEEKFKELITWIKELPFNNSDRQSINCSILDKCIVKSIEDVLNYNVFLEEPKQVELDLSPNSVFCPSNSFSRNQPDSNVKFNLYDRVVNTKNGILVPQGLKGILIGINEDEHNPENQLLTIIFDECFQGGMKINCDTNRVYILPQFYVINISYGKKKPINSKLDFVLPPVTSRFTKETFKNQKKNGKDPYSNMSFNYWATMKFNKFNGEEKNEISKSNNRDFFKQQFKKKEKKIDKKSTEIKTNEFYTNNKISQIENQFNLNNNQIKILKNNEKQNEVKKNLNKNYFKEKLKEYCIKKCLIYPTFLADRKDVKIEMPFLHSNFSTIKKIKNSDVDDAFEKASKSILKEMNLSTIKPPTFVLSELNNLEHDYKIPIPPSSWLK